MRWAVFKDYRGVAFCEPVNENIDVWVMEVPVRKEKRNLITRRVVQPKREAERRIKGVFNDSYYSRKDYYESAFAPAPEGYVFRDDIRYLVESRWGPVDVLVFIKDDNMGRRMQYEFRKLAPEHELYDLGKPRIKDATPDPITDRLIEELRRKFGG